MNGLGTVCYLIGGGCALAAFLLPFAIDFVHLRWRRIWALARLSFKEAIRRPASAVGLLGNGAGVPVRQLVLTV